MKNYKRIGVLGGMSPETTVEFYHSIIREHFNDHGDYAYPEVVIFSVNFKRIIDLQESGNRAINRFASAVAGALADERTLAPAGSVIAAQTAATTAGWP